MFFREELRSIRARAIQAATHADMVPSWRRSFLALADAADHLDAKLARLELYGGDPATDPDRYRPFPEPPKTPSPLAGEGRGEGE